MKNAKKLLSYTYFGFFTALLMSAPAFAYLDPGTVTYVVSMIAGLFIAGGAALAYTWPAPLEAVFPEPRQEEGYHRFRCEGRRGRRV